MTVWNVSAIGMLVLAPVLALALRRGYGTRRLGRYQSAYVLGFLVLVGVILAVSWHKG